MSEHPTPDSVQSNSIAFAAAPSISKLLGVPTILPGESADLYQASLDTLIEELGARSVLQGYLAEKIHECLCSKLNCLCIGVLLCDGIAKGRLAHAGNLIFLKGCCVKQLIV